MYLSLNNGVKMPVLGLGTFPLKGEACTKTIIKAFEIGYISFDTAAAYANSEAIGNALRHLGVSRDRYFITTKLSNRAQETGDVINACKETLTYLGLDYVDLYLMHWPFPERYTENWMKMEEINKAGLARAIGVCNFHEHHLTMLLKSANIVPAVNQFELHPLLTQIPLRKYCEKLGIQVESYAPLARMNPLLTNSPILAGIAQKYTKTIPQIILRWNIQNKVIAIPKSQNEERLKENIEIFDFSLTDDELSEINKLNTDFRVRHDPDNCDMTKL